MQINVGRKQLRLFIALAVGLSMRCRPPTTSFVPASTIIPVPLADRSAVPVATSTSLPVPTASSTAASMPGGQSPTATPDMAATVTALQTPRVLASYPSPDGRWRADVIIYDCVKVGDTGMNAYEQLKLIRVSDNTDETIDSQLRYCEGLGAFGFQGLFWSPNIRALIYLQTITYCPPRGKSYVGRIDLPDLQHTWLIESEAPSFDDAKWDAPNRLRLFDEEGKEWRYDLATKQLRPAP